MAKPEKEGKTQIKYTTGAQQSRQSEETPGQQEHSRLELRQSGCSMLQASLPLQRQLLVRNPKALNRLFSGI